VRGPEIWVKLLFLAWRKLLTFCTWLSRHGKQYNCKLVETMQRVKKTVISDGNSYLLRQLYVVQQQCVTRIQTPVTWIGLKALCSVSLNGESQDPQLRFSETWCYRTQFKWIVHKRSPAGFLPEMVKNRGQNKANDVHLSFGELPTK
jgi:hypothetical protein